MDPPLRLGRLILSDVNPVVKAETENHTRNPNPLPHKKMSTTGMEPNFMDGGVGGGGDSGMSNGGDGVFMVSN